MGFNLRTITENIRFEQAVTLNALERAVPQDEVEAVIEDLGMREKRVRKLPAFITLLLCIGMGLYTNIGLESVLNKMVKGLRYIWPGDADYQTAGRSAISQARYRLGAKPVVELFHRICSNSRFVAALSIAGASCHIKRSARYRNRSYNPRFFP